MKETQSFKMYGNINRAYLEQLGNNYLVYASSSKYKRNVNTHMFTSKKEAVLTRNEINKQIRK
jgi:hypothetical protein